MNQKPLVTALAATLALALAPGAGADHSVVEQVSAGEINGNGAFNPGFDGASADGRHAFFTTDERLVSADTDTTFDVYERFGGVTTLVSAGQTGGNGAFDADFRDASADGTRVFFATAEQLVSADTDTSGDVYERAGGVTTLVSAGQINGNGAFVAGFRDVSKDGTRVFFATGERLVSADTDSSSDVYERAGGVTTLVSAGETGANGDFDVVYDSASADGARVIFRTVEQLVAADTDTSFDVYERAGGVTTLVSAGQTGGNGAFDAASLGASADGTRVLFETNERLVAADTDSSIDIYERSAGVTTRVSAGETGGNGAFLADYKGVSADGTRVFFTTSEPLVGADTDNARDLYERAGGVTRLVSAGQTGGNGAFGVFFGRASADGTRVFFLTAEPLVGADTDNATDVYERFGGVTRLVSAGQTGGNGAFEASLQGASADGARVFFDTNEPLVGADTDNAVDVYERAGGVTTLVSAGQTGGNGAFGAAFVGASADGTRVFFNTAESLVSADTDSSPDIYSASVYSASVAPPQPSAGGGGGTGGTGDSGGAGTPPDTANPVLGTPRLSSSRFRAARSGPSSAASVGARVRYSLSEPATTRFRVEKARSGRWVRLKRSFTHRGQAGTNRFRFTGRIGGRRLRTGRYRLVAVATDAAGNKSAAKRVRFRIVR